MEKKPRKKKELKVKIDTKHIDVDFSRDADGKVELNIDTPTIDAHYTKDEEGHKELRIVDGREYEFVSNGKSPHMPKGTIWKITGELLRNFIKKGLGKHK